jgi:hypothetical protein
MLNRTHSQIVSDVGVTPLREKLRERGIDLPDATVRAWPRRDSGAGSIPPEYWQALADLGVSTLEELAAAKAASRFSDVAA